MPVSRPLLVALVGAVLALVVFYATSGSRNSGDDGGSEVAQPQSEPAKSSKDSDSTASKGDAAKSEATTGDGGSSKADSNSRAVDSGSTAAKDEREQPATAVPADVARALARDRTVVLLFRQRGSADDDATARAVAGVRGDRGVAVFSAPISRLDDFAAITGSISISQAPAVVIVGRRGQARLIEGFIDEETLAQEVADSR